MADGFLRFPVTCGRSVDVSGDGGVRTLAVYRFPGFMWQRREDSHVGAG